MCGSKAFIEAADHLQVEVYIFLSLCMSVCIFPIFSQMIGLTWLNFFKGDGDKPGVFNDTFGEDLSETLMVGLFFFLWFFYFLIFLIFKISLV